MSDGVISPMPRIVPKEGARISGRFIPGGVSDLRPHDKAQRVDKPQSKTVVGISNCFVHNDPEIFPEPALFKPERWLQPDTKGGQSLDYWLVAFSKGPRSCLGQK